MMPDDTHRELAVLVNITFQGNAGEETLTEFQELTSAAGAKPAAVITGIRSAPDAKYFVGSGKAEEIRATVAATNATLVLFNHSLSPGQIRNLQRLVQCKVIDRTHLILDIFAQRARTFEGKLQVELAQLRYLSTHLVRGWTHLERQRGGIGLRGPGETQLETDRRLIRTRIKLLTQRLEKVRKQRKQGRRMRQRGEVPSVSIVGYTNAGKSTLFNYLTGAEVYAADQPFATLDPTLRRIKLPNNTTVVLADTVGFIRQLPVDLVEAFRATLEETQEADLLLHVVDAANKNKSELIEQVNEVLKQISADHIPQLLVYNKTDQLTHQEPHLERNATGKPWRVWLSALTGAGIDLLLSAISELLETAIVVHEIILTATQGRLRAQLYEQGFICNESIDENGAWHLTVRLPELSWQELQKQVTVIDNSSFR